MEQEQSFEQKVRDAIAHPKHLGEMTDADAVGTAGSAGCGDLLRFWIRFRQENGRKVVDRASFQSFGCETAIAVAGLAAEMIKGKTAEEALCMKGEEFAAELGSLPPMKVHCGALVEAALRDALASDLNRETGPGASANPECGGPTPSLSDSFRGADRAVSSRRIVLLDPKDSKDC